VRPASHEAAPLGVRVRDVNIVTGVVTLSHQVQNYSKRLVEGTRYIADDGFGNSSTVFLNHLKTPESHGTFKLNSASLPEILAAMVGKNPDDLIFTTKNGTPCTPDNFRSRHWKPCLKRLGLNHKIKLTPKAMRRFVLAKGVNSGGDSMELSKTLRHKDISTTAIHYWEDIEDNDKANPLEFMSEVVTGRVPANS
jgi:hypothetical protein